MIRETPDKKDAVKPEEPPRSPPARDFAPAPRTIIPRLSLEHWTNSFSRHPR